MAFTIPQPLHPSRRRRRPWTEPRMTLQPRRSKMILTRRIHTWTLKKPSKKPEPAQLTQGQQKPPQESKKSTPAFLFRRPQYYANKRRPADPPYKYLQLTTTNQPLPSFTNTNTSNTSKLHLTPDKLFSSHDPPQPRASPKRPLPLYTKLCTLYARPPRVIVIGDVHGCLRELESLLELCDYTPADQVLLLGDMVAKGPDSAGVVRLARELGARAVRGNHDYEVIRVAECGRGAVSVEHARIAGMLSRAEHAWLAECPWFVEWPEAGYLFVHAGFIPGVKLTQQNPRLMMNMRSVMDDGTVTARHVLGCEWARLWKGPQRVVFGHDAYRGLQMYDHAIGIDTGCVYGGRLTALLLPENRLVSVAARKAYISPKRFRGLRERDAD